MIFFSALLEGTTEIGSPPSQEVNLVFDNVGYSRPLTPSTKNFLKLLNFFLSSIKIEPEKISYNLIVKFP